MVKTIDWQNSYILDLKDDLIKEISNDSAKGIESIVNEGIKLLGKERIENILYRGVQIIGSYVHIDPEKIDILKDKHYEEIATRLADIQKNLGDNYPEFRLEFLRLLKALQFNSADGELFQKILDNYVKLKDELRMADSMLKKEENETKEEYKKRIETDINNGYDFLTKKPVLMDELAAIEKHFAKIISYYAQNFSEIAGVANFVFNFFGQEKDLEKILDLVEAFYFPIEDRQITRPHKMNYIVHAIKLLKERPVEKVSEWSYKVNEKLDEQESKGNYDLDKAMLDAYNELFKVNNNYTITIIQA